VQPRTTSVPPKPQDAAVNELRWKSAISHIQPNEIRLRGYRIDELMGRVSFSQAIFLVLTGELPSPAVGQLLDAMFVSSIDHGASPPSAFAARVAASSGAPFNAAVAAGLLSINQHHGGAIEDSVTLVRSALEIARRDGVSPAQAAAEIVARYRQEKKRLPGFGHRVHTADPRTARLLQLAETLGLAGEGVAMLRAIETAWAEAAGKPLPVNVDGALAGLLIDLKLPPELANTFFMMSRLPGLVAQVHEEKTRERPMRTIHPTDYDYDGPPDRSPLEPDAR
jgi:citrate synthase